MISGVALHGQPNQRISTASSHHVSAQSTLNTMPKFSLRAHKAALTCIAHHLGTIVSSDRDGWIIIWNITSRRPMALWKAHEGHILTLKSTPLGLMSHGRDSMIRIWNVAHNELERCSKNGSDISPVGSSPAAGLPKPPHAEIPVNALNFCNIDFFDGLLITPATVNSENFDLYKVSDPFGEFNFERLLHNVSPQDIQKSDNLVEEIDGVSGTDKRSGHGIVMQTLFVNQNLFFVGYESGAVYGFRIKHANIDKSSEGERLVVFSDYNLRVVFSSLDHKPSPVLSLALDQTTHVLYTGSASKQLISYDIGHLTGQMRTGKEDGLMKKSSHNLRHYGIQCIQITNNIVLTGFWDGVIKGYTKDLEEVVRLERKEEYIKPEGDEELSKPAKKSLCMELWVPENDAPTSMSRKARLRRAVVGQESILFVGFGDGLISAFEGIS
ncbi:hypothetical protein OXX79_009074 [Metschnikowia pulcherrima]